LYGIKGSPDVKATRLTQDFGNYQPVIKYGKRRRNKRKGRVVSRSGMLGSKIAASYNEGVEEVKN